jgi:ABC-type lipoprotein release transport system permease subunit
VQPTDAVTYVSVALLLLTAGALACVVPARRAAAIEITAALRAE